MVFPERSIGINNVVDEILHMCLYDTDNKLWQVTYQTVLQGDP
jgi:hypothetical protein